MKKALREYYNVCQSSRGVRAAAEIAVMRPVDGRRPAPRSGEGERHPGCSGESECLRLAARLNWRGLDCSWCSVRALPAPPLVDLAELAMSRRGEGELPPRGLDTGECLSLSMRTVKRRRMAALRFGKGEKQ